MQWHTWILEMLYCRRARIRVRDDSKYAYIFSLLLHIKSFYFICIFSFMHICTLPNVTHYTKVCYSVIFSLMVSIFFLKLMLIVQTSKAEVIMQISLTNGRTQNKWNIWWVCSSIRVTNELNFSFWFYVSFCKYTNFVQIFRHTIWTHRKKLCCYWNNEYCKCSSTV